MGNFLSSLAERFWRRSAIVSVAALALAYLFIQLPPMKNLGLQISDQQALMLAPRMDFDDIVIVDIDEQSMVELRAQLGEWPYERTVYAGVTDLLRNAGARHITYDILFSESRQGDADFAEALLRTPNTALAAHSAQPSPERDAHYRARFAALGWPVQAAAPANQRDDVTLPLPAFTAAAGVGLINVAADGDGVYRRMPLFHEVYGHYLPSLALASLFTGAQRPPVAYDPDSRMLAVGHLLLPVTVGGEVLLQLPRRADLDAITIVPFHEIVAASQDPAAAANIAPLLQGKRVYVGSSSTSLNDFVYTPHGKTAGLLMLATSATRIERGMVLRPPKPWLDGIFVLIALMVPTLTFRNRVQDNPLLSVITLALTLVLIMVLSAWFYLQHQASSPLYAMTVAVFAFGSLLSLRLVALRREKQRLALEKLAAQQAYELKSRFISQMTHELRTPLAAIMGYNRLLGEAALADDHREQYTHVVARNSQHLMTLINNMLDQSKLEAGQLKITKAAADLRELIGDVIATMTPLASEKKLALLASYEGEVPRSVELDALRLRQVLINLIGNAIKFTPEGQVSVRVAWAAERLTIDVQDTGPGIPAHALERIFVPFKQGSDDTERVHGGTGLGLSISRNFCELMGGGLDVRSALGSGSTFSVNIAAPRCAEPVRAAEQPKAQAAEEKLTGRVLLADDNQDIRELLTRYLMRMGVSVLAAKDGKEALDMALREKPDAVLMDMEMPVMRGNTAVRNLRQAGFDRPILALTAHPEGPEVEQAMRDGCDGYVAKPVSRSRLHSTLQALLQRRSPANDAVAEAARAEVAIADKRAHG